MSEIISKISKLYFKFRNYFSCHFPRLYHICDKYKIFVKCTFSGVTVAFIELVVLFICYHVVSWPLVVSTSIAFVCSFLFSFSLQKFWTFRNFSQSKTARQLIMYFFNAFIGLNLNGFFMHKLVNQYHIWYLLAQVIVILTIGVYNFAIYNLVIFKKEKKEKNEINHEQKTVRGDAGDLA